MRTILRFFWVLFLLGLIMGIAQIAGMKEDQTPAVALVFLVGYWLFRRRKKESAQPESKSAATPASTSNPNGARYVLDCVNDVLEVFEGKLTITPKRNAASILVRGMKGSKTIPFASITAIQLREANPINGYIQFSILGGVESGGGIIAAIGDENTCFFLEPANKLAREIKDFIESRMAEGKASKATSTVNIADELQKLASLNAQGALSDEEFTAAKKRLI